MYYPDSAHKVRADTQILNDVLNLLDNKPDHFVAMPERLYHFDFEEMGDLNFFNLESPTRYESTFTTVRNNGMQQAWSLDARYNTPEFKQVLLERAKLFQDNRKGILADLRTIIRDTYRGSAGYSPNFLEQKITSIGRNIDTLIDKYEREWQILVLDGLVSE